MAKSTKKESSVESKLKSLYELQKVNSKIDEIRILRGDLPLEVQDIEDEIEGLSTRLENIQTEIEDLERNITGRKVTIEESTMKIARYTEQQDNVKNNREFENLSKEIEFQNLEIELSEKKIREFTEAVALKKDDQEHTTNALQERKLDLESKKGELDEIISETRQEEEKLRNKAKRLEQNIDERLGMAFKRIRKGARNGLAVVYVDRDACGGCFNKVPAQRQLDVRSRKKIIVCEYCGRILVDTDLAGVKPRKVATKAPRKTTRKTATKK